jgi:hypothetical protein
MCIDKIKAFFGWGGNNNGHETPTPVDEQTVEPTTPEILPHEEEPPDDSRTIENTNATDVLNRWFSEWNVPEEHREYWRNFEIIISLEYSSPAATSSEVNKMWLRPEWANPGVIAHELAHESYSLLSEADKAAYETEFNNYLTTDSWMILLDSQNDYMNTNIIEGHAEVYRYLGDKMPEALKRYYPKMF